MCDEYTSLVHRIALDEPNSGYSTENCEKIDLSNEDLATVVETEPDLLCSLFNRWDIDLVTQQIIQGLRTGDDAALGRVLKREIKAQCQKEILPDVRLECDRLSDRRTTQREIERRRADAASIPAQGPM